MRAIAAGGVTRCRFPLELGAVRGSAECGPHRQRIGPGRVPTQAPGGLTSLPQATDDRSMRLPLAAPALESSMLALFSYPELFGVADNSGYGLKVFASLRLAGVLFRHEHMFDALQAPRGQLPYIVDDGETIDDSVAIIDHVTISTQHCGDSLSNATS